jgi:hypothetical protein
MRCSIPGKAELISRAPEDSVTDTADWVTQVTRLSLGDQQQAQTVRLNVEIEGRGTVWVQNVLLAQAAK